MQITWFGHSCFRINAGASRILIDPLLSGNATFERSGVPVHQVIDGVTHVALTHGHEDHTGDTVRICKETGAALLAVHELATYLAGRQHRRHAASRRFRPDLRPRLAFVLAYGRWSPGLSRRLLRAHHCAQRRKDGLSYGRYGHLLRHGAHRRNPCAEDRLRADRRPLHHGREDGGARLQARFFDFEVIVPCHYGTFPVLDQTADQFIAAFGKDKVLVPAVGVAFKA